MTREEFCALPPAAALGILWDVMGVKHLAHLPAPRLPLPPKFDTRRYCKGGFVWMSEMTLDDLRYWLDRVRKSAAEGGKYADKDAKQAKSIGYWVAWREYYPDAIWSGERDHMKFTAYPPSREPTVYLKGPVEANAPAAEYFKEGESAPAAPVATAGYFAEEPRDEYSLGAKIPDDSDIPF